MLIYHPAFDINHARLRIIQLVENLDHKEIPFDMLRILDFYFLFPHLLINVRLTSKLIKFRRELGRQASKYNRVPAPKVLIRQMEGIHETAVLALQMSNLIDLPGPDMTRLKRSDTPLPDQLQRIIAGQPEQEQALALTLAREVSKIPLHGPDGLKARTGLFEYRYDPA